MDIPAEILDLILGEVYYRARFNAPDYQALYSCSLINSQWRWPAQTLLFRCITREVGSAFASRVQDLAPDLLAHVCIFAIRLLAEDLPLLTAVLRRCPNLYELTIESRNIFSWSEESEAAIIAAATSLRIRSLRVTLCSVESPLLYQLLALFPGVEFLTLGGEINAPPPKGPPPCALYELRCQRTPASWVLRWLLSASVSSLRILELRDLPNKDTPADLAACCPTIQSLRLMRYNNYATAIIAQCTALRELVFLNVPARVFLGVLPPTLEHFAVLTQTYATAVDLESIVEAVRSLPQLRILSFVGDAQQTAVLRAVCDERGVALWNTTQKYWMDDDPVKTTRFPRSHSVSSFWKLMK